MVATIRTKLPTMTIALATPRLRSRRRMGTECAMTTPAPNISTKASVEHHGLIVMEKR
jgi:hypothetical protein